MPHSIINMKKHLTKSITFFIIILIHTHTTLNEWQIKKIVMLGVIIPSIQRTVTNTIYVYLYFFIPWQGKGYVHVDCIKIHNTKPHNQPKYSVFEKQYFIIYMENGKSWWMWGLIYKICISIEIYGSM